MQLDHLLTKLRLAKGVTIKIEETEDAKIVTVSTILPEVPFGRNQHSWYSLVVEDNGKAHIPETEIRAMQRHLWILSLDLC